MSYGLLVWSTLNWCHVCARRAGVDGPSPDHPNPPELLSSVTSSTGLRSAGPPLRVVSSLSRAAPREDPRGRRVQPRHSRGSAPGCERAHQLRLPPQGAVYVVTWDCTNFWQIRPTGCITKEPSEFGSVRLCFFCR